ncbi:hypothetical protein F5883DRAFT_174642 [Diaporthe sp. PMI_573]|nr:hypothetical protein F5883DRAFT_174642 [Diaporthaceae sp. PMI_573]
MGKRFSFTGNTLQQDMRSSPPRPESKKKPAKQQGLFVPKGILEKVKSNFDERTAFSEEEWWQELEKGYPNIPPADKAEIHRRCYLPFSDRTTKPEWTNTFVKMRQYVLERYTAFKSLAIDECNMEAAAKAHREADKILSIWRGGSESEE